jgi:hypothetical protein
MAFLSNSTTVLKWYRDALASEQRAEANANSLVRPRARLNHFMTTLAAASTRPHIPATCSTAPESRLRPTGP